MRTEEEKVAMSECWKCEHKRNVAGNAHIQCVKPDPDMMGDPHGIKHGWFYYPMLFDPTWKTKQCSNFSLKSNAVSDAVSSAVSEETKPNTTNVNL